MMLSMAQSLEAVEVQIERSKHKQNLEQECYGYLFPPPMPGVGTFYPLSEIVPENIIPA